MRRRASAHRENRWQQGRSYAGDVADLAYLRWASDSDARCVLRSGPACLSVAGGLIMFWNRTEVTEVNGYAVPSSVRSAGPAKSLEPFSWTRVR